MDKEHIYIDVTQQISAVTEKEYNIIARMATISCLLSEAFEDFFWAGFYLIAVLDVDSEKAANFDESDRQRPEQIIGNIFARCTPGPN